MSDIDSHYVQRLQEVSTTKSDSYISSSCGNDDVVAEFPTTTTALAEKTVFVGEAEIKPLQDRAVPSLTESHQPLNVNRPAEVTRAASSQSGYNSSTTTVHYTDSIPVAVPENNDAVQQSPSFWQGCKRWIVEVILCLISLGTFAAMIITLRTYDNRPVPSLPLNITLNTLVAFLVTIAKAALTPPIAEAISQCKWGWFDKQRSLVDFDTFDKASRGTLGSLILLPRTRWRNIATIGAVVYIIGVVTSPVTQQAVGYIPRLASTNLTATTWATDTVMLQYDHSFFSAQTVNRIITGGMTYHDGFALTPDCATAECTFPPYSTLAVCTKVVDLSHLVDFRYDPKLNSSEWNLWPDGIPLTPYDSSYSGGFNASMPSTGFWMTTPTPFSAQTWSLNNTISFANDSSLQSTLLYDSVLMYIRPKELTDKIDSNREKVDPDAFIASAVELIYYLCIQDIETSVSQGDTTEIRKEAPSTIIQSNDIVPYVVYCGDSNPGKFCKSATFTNTTVGQITLQSEDGRRFTGSYDTLVRISYQLYQQIDGYMSCDTYIATYGDKGSYINNFLTSALGPYQVDSVFGQLESAATRLANAATDVFRTLPQSGNATNSYAIKGIAWSNVDYVQMRWGWLAFLTLQLCFGIFFVLFVAISTSLKNETILKSSMLAALVALDSKSRDACGKLESLGDIRTRIVGGRSGPLRAVREGMTLKVTRSEQSPV